MWTINDFPNYKMISGWSTHVKLSCLYCMENNKVFTLTNNDKSSVFKCHQRFLPMDHKFRKNKKDFYIGIVERDVASPFLLGEKLYNVVSEYGDIKFDFQFGKQKFFGFGLTHNWVKRSIFFSFLIRRPIFSIII